MDFKATERKIEQVRKMRACATGDAGSFTNKMNPKEIDYQKDSNEITELRKQYEAWLASPENQEFEAWAREQHKRIDKELKLLYVQPLLKNAIPKK